MHYKNGREAKIGDKVYVPNQGGQPYIGLLVEANAGSTTCNGRVIPLPLANMNYATIGDLLHLDEAIAENGTVPQYGKPV